MLYPSLDINASHNCPSCSGSLTVRLSRGGKFPGQYCLDCHSEAFGCTFHYTFPKSSALLLRPETNVIISPGATPALPDVPKGPIGYVPIPAAPPIFHVLPPALPASLSAQTGRNVKSRKRKRLGIDSDACNMDCGGTRHSSCQHASCKQCCIVSGGCKAPGHNVAALSDRQKAKLGITTGSSAHDGIPLPRSAEEQAWLAQGQVFAAMEAPRVADHTATLRDDADTAALEAREEAELDAIMSQSAAEYDYTQSQAAAAIDTNINLAIALSKAEMTSSQATAQAGPSARASSSMSAPMSRSSMTQQLSPLWMRQITGMEAAASTDQSVKRAKRATEAIVARQFKVVCFPGTFLSFKVINVQGDTSFPHFSLDNNPEVLGVLGAATQTVEVYNAKSKQWETTHITMLLTVPDMRHIFVRCLDTNPVDFDDVYQMMCPEPCNHLRTNMPAERRALRSAYKRADTIIEDDSDVEILTDLIPTCAEAKGKPKAARLAPPTLSAKALGKLRATTPLPTPPSASSNVSFNWSPQSSPPPSPPSSYRGAQNFCTCLRRAP
ncbi:hypothetical protein HGRIS_003856 [Hohenbuehelia grisea]|uniref:Uncharacterized protein n=1 Tax=Hohenbuehelia grisea TaxID=104357 RepID=A0ABR3JHV6_9AGAR